MYENFIILYKINAAVYAVFALAGSAYMGKSQGVKAINAFGLGTVGSDALFGVACLNNGFGYILVAHTRLVYFIKNPKGFAAGVY